MHFLHKSPKHRNQFDHHGRRCTNRIVKEEAILDDFSSFNLLTGNMVSSCSKTKPLKHRMRMDTEVQIKEYRGIISREKHSKAILPDVKSIHSDMKISRILQNVKRNHSDSFLYPHSKKKDEFSLKEMKGVVGTIYQYDASKKVSLPRPSVMYKTSTVGRPRVLAETRSSRVKSVSSLFSSCINTLLKEVRKRPDSSREETSPRNESDLEPEERIINELERNMKTECNWPRRMTLPVYGNYQATVMISSNNQAAKLATNALSKSVPALRIPNLVPTQFRSKEENNLKRNCSWRKQCEKRICESRSAHNNNQEWFRPRESTSQTKGTENKALGVASRRRLVFPGPSTNFAPVRIRSASSPSTCNASCGSSVTNSYSEQELDKDPEIFLGKFPKISTDLVHRWIKRTAADVRSKESHQTLSQKVPFRSVNCDTHKTKNHLKSPWR